MSQATVTATGLEHELPKDVQSPDPPSVTRIKALLQRTLRIFISDGRIFIGTFMCTDKQRNVILTNTEEFRLGGSHQGRYVGMIMIPWKLVTRAEVDSGGIEDDEGQLYT